MLSLLLLSAFDRDYLKCVNYLVTVIKARQDAWFVFAVNRFHVDKVLPPIHPKPSSDVLLLPLRVSNPSDRYLVIAHLNTSLYSELVKKLFLGY